MIIILMEIFEFNSLCGLEFRNCLFAANQFLHLSVFSTFVSMSSSKRVYLGPHSTKLGKLPRDARERDIEDLCSKFGRIKDVRLLQGFGFVEFDDARDAEDAVRDLDNQKFMGERLVVGNNLELSLKLQREVDGSDNVLRYAVRTTTSEESIGLFQTKLDCKFWVCQLVPLGKTSKTLCAKLVKYNIQILIVTEMGMSHVNLVL
jgi:RNA recognition motif-containing protein